MVLEASPLPIITSNPKMQVDIEASVAQDNSEAIRKDSISIAIREDSQRLRVTEKSDLTTPEDLENPSYTSVNRSKKSIRLGIAIFSSILLVLGRLGVPEVEVPCVQDKVLDALEFANVFILTPGNELYRDAFQLLCSIMVDITALMTFIHWIRKGTSYRLPLSLMAFYAVRAMIQAIWVSPFTKGYYWESPGLPSLVVPYGRGSDFFFSGHTGFMVTCALEWHYLKMPRVRNFVAFAAVYTMTILMIYQIHYSIDIFVGAFFAEWMFVKIDIYKDVIADKIGFVFHKVVGCFGGRFMAPYKGM